MKNIAALFIFFFFSVPQVYAQTSDLSKVEKTEEIIVIPHFTATFSNIHGTIKRFRIFREQYYQKEKEMFSGAPEYLFARGPMEMVTTWDPEYYPFRIDFKSLTAKEKVKRVMKMKEPGTVKEGSFEEIFRDDPVFTLTRKTLNEIVYVFPDPETDSSPVFIEKKYRVSGSYSISLTVTVYNFSPDEIREQTAMNISAWQTPDLPKSSFLGPIPDNTNGACHVGGSMKIVEVPDMLGHEQSYPQIAEWGGVNSRYFLMAAVPPESMNPQCSTLAFANGVIQTKIHETNNNIIAGASNFCIPDFLPLREGQTRCSDDYKTLGLKGTESLNEVKAAVDRIRRNNPEKDSLISEPYKRILGKRNIVYDYVLYLGPKDIDLLKSTKESLTDSIDFWILGFLCKPMLFLLRSFYYAIPHWGVAIAILTLLIKLLTLYWSEKSIKQMKRMQDLKPLMDDIKKKYKDDKQKMNQEVFALYKEHKVNPFGGCLPMLIQMPIWIALYRTIYSSVDLYQAPLFLWITDLSAPDPYFISPVLLGILTFVQQKITPTTMDSAQAKMMLYLMPVMFTVFMLFLPSGLVFYILVNTVLTIIHQSVKVRMQKSGG
jgi:YidC/Oxa1 family membrane protein insertase